MKERPILLTSLVILLAIVGVIIREPDTVPFETQPATHLVG